jgi:hypothetical protein
MGRLEALVDKKKRLSRNEPAMGWISLALNGNIRIGKSMGEALAKRTNTDLSLWFDEDPGAAPDLDGRRKAILEYVAKGPCQPGSIGCPACEGRK